LNLSFYKLSVGTLDQALSKLLPKILSNGMRAVVVLENEEKVDAFNASLWTLGSGSFTPHGSSKDAIDPMLQPIWLTDKFENPNKSEVVVLAGMPHSGDLDTLEFKRVVVVFNSNIPDQTEGSRTLWLRYPDLEKTLWCQSKIGEWIKQDGFD